MKTLYMMSRYWLLATIVFMAAVLTACQSGPPQISIDGAKAELSPAIVGEAMVTMNIRNRGGSDVLTGVKTDIAGAKAAFHVMQGERMVSAEMVKVPSKSDLKLEMGGSHIMIEDMPKTMKEGSPFKLVLVFQKSGEKTVPLSLQKAAAMPMDMEHHM